MMMNRLANVGSGSWVRAAEHAILRIVSMVFSLGSAYAIRVFFAPLGAADSGEAVITWAIAAGFGVLGYVVSRGLVHRMMRKESIWAYAPICLLVELVDISCNYVLAASVVGQASWLHAVPENQRGILTIITYVVLSAIPLVSLFLAVVDMDLEREKHGSVVSGATGKPFVMPKPLQAPGKPIVPPKAPSSQVPARAGGQGPVSAFAGSGGNTSTAAKRASFWGSQQGRVGSPVSSSAGNATATSSVYDPEKDLMEV